MKSSLGLVPRALLLENCADAETNCVTISIITERVIPLLLAGSISHLSC